MVSYSSTLSTALLGLIAALPAALALPNVTAVPLTNGCSDYPLYQFRGTPGEAGPFPLKIVDSGNTSAEGLYSSVEVQRRSTLNVQWGQITYANAPAEDRTYTRCSNNSLQAYAPVNFPDYGWVDLAYAVTFGAAGYFPGTSEPLRPFAHYVGAVRQNGTYIGAYNVTTWAFAYNTAAQSTHARPFFVARLLPPGQNLRVGEFTGFVVADTLP